jgi:hypothetical protein
MGGFSNYMRSADMLPCCGWWYSSALFHRRFFFRPGIHFGSVQMHPLYKNMFQNVQKIPKKTIACIFIHYMFVHKVFLKNTFLCLVQKYNFFLCFWLFKRCFWYSLHMPQKKTFFVETLRANIECPYADMNFVMNFYIFRFVTYEFFIMVASTSMIQNTTLVF